jgi:hypothetical protein
MASYLVGAVAVGFLLGISGVQAASLPVPTVEYSADRIIESEAGTFNGKVYAAKDKERTEISMRGMQSVTILRRDKKLSWMLMPSHRMYSEMDLVRAQHQSGSAPADDVSIESVGTETIEGFETTKYKMLMKDGSAGGFIWITQQGITIKMDLLSKSEGKKTRMTVTLTNLQIGPQDAQLFELPSDYNAMPSMGAGMKNLGSFGTR